MDGINFKDGNCDHLEYYDNNGLNLQITRNSENVFNSYKHGRTVILESVEEFWNRFYPQAKSL